MVEILASVSIVGILCAIAIPIFTRITEVSRTELAQSIVARINGALITHRQANADIVVAANNSGTADETTVMTILQTRDDAVPGSPLLSGLGWPSVSCDDPKLPRLRWNGRFFELIEETTNGKGLLIKQ